MPALIAILSVFNKEQAMDGVHGMTLGVIFGNRDFFPDGLVSEARRDLMQVLSDLGIQMVALTSGQTKLGAVETWQDAVLCGQMLSAQKHCIDGVLVCLPNFGD